MKICALKNHIGYLRTILHSSTIHLTLRKSNLILFKNVTTTNYREVTSKTYIKNCSRCYRSKNRKRSSDQQSRMMNLLTIKFVRDTRSAENLRYFVNVIQSQKSLRNTTLTASNAKPRREPNWVLDKKFQMSIMVCSSAKI